MPPKKSNLTNARSREARRKRVERARQSAEKIRISKRKELGTQEKYVDDGRHQEALENLHTSDPSHSTSSCSQTILTLGKIKENFDLQESQDDDNLNLHTHIDIKQDDNEDIETCVSNLFPASSSQMNSACGSLSRELHIETFTEHDPLNTIDVIVMKAEPGSPSSDISIHSDAGDSPEDQEIKVTLRKKMKMLNENKEILKRIHEEISILKKERKELVTDIKYLRNMSMKKCKLLELNEL